MVIDYSETINQYTELDGYPFPDIEERPAGAAQDRFFSRVDFKSTYHQIPWQKQTDPSLPSKGMVFCISSQTCLWPDKCDECL